MAEEKQQRHHLFHRHKDGEQENPAEVDYEKKEKHHKHMEQLGQLGAVAAGAYALHEKHKAKKDPENAHGHKKKEEIAAVAAVGSAGFAFHEHHEKKDAKITVMMELNWADARARTSQQSFVSFADFSESHQIGVTQVGVVMGQGPILTPH